MAITDFPQKTQNLARHLEAQGFELALGSGRDYYMLYAKKQQSDYTIDVHMDDENTADVTISNKAGLEICLARFGSLNQDMAYTAVVNYIMGFVV